VAALINSIEKYGVTTIADKSDVPLPDESDRVFYDVAKKGKAILVTGNIKHFPLEPFIMTPAEFLSKLI